MAWRTNQTKCTRKCSPRTNWNEVLTELGPETQNRRHAVFSYIVNCNELMKVFVPRVQNQCTTTHNNFPNRSDQQPIKMQTIFSSYIQAPQHHKIHQIAAPTQGESSAVPVNCIANEEAKRFGLK
jgi:hypothetical protein